MTEGEAKTVIEIMMEADGGCSNCARHLLEQFIAKYPVFKEKAQAMFNKEFSRTL